jgi:O-Antigen ligase
VNRLWAAATFASLGLVLAGTGVVAPLVPLAAVAALALVLSARLQTTALALLAVALLVDNPGERPAEGRWQSPLFAVGELLYENLHKHTGIGALRFSALEAVILLLGMLLLYRKVWGVRLDDPDGLGAIPNPMKVAFGMFLATLVGLEVYGLARGGDFKNSLWQARQLFWLPVLGVVFGNAFKTSGARVGVLRVLVAVAWVRSLIGIYFTYAIVRPSGWELEYVMTHSDAILGVVAMLIAAATWVERPTVSHVLMNLLVQPVLLMGLHVNDRRIAFVALAGGALALILMGPSWMRTTTRKGLIVMVPALVLYILVGWHSSSPVFGPVATLRAIATSEDTSSQTRDIENFNLIQTLKQRPILGSGFGHEYVELVQAYKVDHLFAQYKFIAHNSVLWLLSLSGWIGFAALWSLFPVGVAVALSVHRTATLPLDRVAAFGAVAATISFLVQAWGDMGLQSWMGTLVLASLLGATGALHTRQHSEVIAS